MELIYCDALVYIYLGCSTLSIAIVHCIVKLEAGSYLDYLVAKMYSGIVEFFVFCLTTSVIVIGVLRLISLVRKSETAGLQPLGPEDIAAVKIRWASIIFSATYKCKFEFHFNVQSGIFILFCVQNYDSIPQSVSQKIFQSSFLVWILLALIINTIIVN